MESEVGNGGGQHHPDGGSTGIPKKRQLRVIPSITSSIAAAPPLHTIAEEINDCGDQNTEPPLASTRSPPLNPDEPPPYPGPPPTTSTSPQHLQRSPTTDQPPDSTETAQYSHTQSQMQPYPSIEMSSYKGVPSAPIMQQQLVMESAVHPQLQQGNLQALLPVTTSPENNSTSIDMPSYRAVPSAPVLPQQFVINSNGFAVLPHQPPSPVNNSMLRFAPSGVYAPQSHVSPLQGAVPLHLSSSLPGDLHACEQVPALDGTQAHTSYIFSPETGKYYVQISNPLSHSSQIFQLDDQRRAHSTSLQQVAETKHSQNIARDSTVQLLPQPDEVTEKQRPHSYFYCTVAMIFVFIFCFDFLFLLLCLLPAAWYAHKAAEAKYRRAFSEVVKYGNKALCFDVLGGIAHLLFIAVIVTSILLILHYVAAAF